MKLDAIVPAPQGLVLAEVQWDSNMVRLIPVYFIGFEHYAYRGPDIEARPVYSQWYLLRKDGSGPWTRDHSYIMGNRNGSCYCDDKISCRKLGVYDLDDYKYEKLEAAAEVRAGFFTKQDQKRAKAREYAANRKKPAQA